MKLSWLLGAAVAILSVPVQWGEGQCTEDEMKEELERILGVRELSISIWVMRGGGEAVEVVIIVAGLG